MSDTLVTSTLSGAAFSDGTELSGTWTTEYDAAGNIVGITQSSFTVTGPAGTNTFTDAYAPYSMPRAGDYEITFPTTSGSGGYNSLYVDWIGEDPTALSGGDQVPYTSVKDGNGTLTLVDAGTVTNAPPCLVRGTMIETSEGEVAVERLEVGATVRLAGGGEGRVVWIGHRRMRPETDAVAPVSIAPGALGRGERGALVPTRPLRLSPDHAVFVDGVLVPAGLLRNDRSITALDLREVEYFHVELESHAVLIADGAPVESYLDTGNRSNFANARIVSIEPHLAPTAGATCAEMVLDGERLEAIRARLAAIADGMSDAELRRAG